jgi:hypothetical protein
VSISSGLNFPSRKWRSKSWRFSSYVGPSIAVSCELQSRVTLFTGRAQIVAVASVAAVHPARQSTQRHDTHLPEDRLSQSLNFGGQIK